MDGVSTGRATSIPNPKGPLFRRAPLTSSYCNLVLAHRAVGAAGLIAGGLWPSACGGTNAEQPHPATNALEAIGQVATAGSTMEQAANDAARFQQDRRARGEAVFLSYEALQTFHRDAPSGYTKAEEPSGSGQTMGTFSMTKTEQKYVASANADGNWSVRSRCTRWADSIPAYMGVGTPPSVTIDYRRQDHLR